MFLSIIVVIGLDNLAGFSVAKVARYDLRFTNKLLRNCLEIKRLARKLDAKYGRFAIHGHNVNFPLMQPDNTLYKR